jgi:hypothetical protein
MMRAAALWPAARALEGAGKEFWKGKDPARWTAQEKEAVLGQSPWARVGALRLEDTRRQQAAPPSTIAAPGGGVPGARPAGQGSAPTGGSVPIGEPIPPPPPGSGKGEMPAFRVLVRWESAKPVRLAGGLPLPEEAAAFYVIGLIGMPLMPRRRTAEGESEPDPNVSLLEAVKRTSRIERRSKPPVPCDHMLTGSGAAAGNVLLFFPRGADPLSLSEKEVTVTGSFGPFRLEVRFPLKEMVFGGALAL